MLEEEVPSEAGPEIAGIEVPGNSKPATLLRVARLIWNEDSSRGRYDVRARSTPDSWAETRAIEARMAG